MPRWTAALLVALLASALALPAIAQWKWRDKNGLTQYSDLPPPLGIADKDILQRPGGPQRPPGATAASSPAAASAVSVGRAGPLIPPSVEPELETRRKQAEQVEADKRKADETRAAASRADNCARARAQLRTLDGGQRIARVNDKGEREILDDAARSEEMRRAQAGIASNCQ